MAVSLPGASPLQNALSQLGVMPKEDRARLTKNAFDGIARETRIPANVLMALDEADGGRGDTARAREYAMRLGSAVSSGKKLEDALTDLAGGQEKGRSIIERSYDIADALYPAQTPAPEATAPQNTGPGIGTDITDTAKAFAAGAVGGAASVARGAGVAVDEGLKSMIGAYGSRDVGKSPEPVEGETIARGAGRMAESKLREGADAISGSISERGQQAMRDSQPDGKLFEPSTWDLGADPSLRGYVMNAAQGAGSMAPLVIAKNPVAAAIMGGLMAGGDGASNGRQFVIDAAKVTDENGVAEVTKLPGYKDMVAAGRSHEQAVMELARRAETDAGFRQSIFGALGGAATNKIFHAAEGWLGAGGRIASAAKKGAAGFTEEGTQEAIEGYAAQSGIAAATGADVDLAQNSFQNFVLGGLAGGATGAAGGLLFGSPKEGDVASGGEAYEGIPQIEGPLGPDRALPSPTNGGAVIAGGRQGYGPGEFERDPARGAQPSPADMAQQPAQFRSNVNALADGSGEGAVGAAGNPDLSGAMPAASAPLGLPSPTNGGAIIAGGRPGYGQGEIERDPSFGPRPGAADMAAQPAQFRPGMNAAAQQPLGASPPAGPIDAIARTIAIPKIDEPTPQVQRFPEYKPGAPVRIGDPDNGNIYDAVFLGEGPDGARIRIAGQEIDLTAEEFDFGRDAVATIEAQKAASPEQGALTGEVITPADVARMQSEAAREAGFEMSPVPSPSSAPWWDAADAEARAAIVKEAGPTAARELNQVKAFGSMSEEGRRAIADAYGRLYRAGTIENGGSIEAPRAQLAQPKLEAPQARPQRIDDLKTATDEQIKVRLAFLKSQGTSNGWNAATTKEHGALAAEAERRASTKDAVEAAALEAHPEPTEAQKEAGNYQKGHANWNGLGLSIENAKGSERRGTDADGEQWSVTMPAHYGYFKRTEGADGDHVDFYMGDVPTSDYVTIIDQVDAKTGKFDEHKVVIGTTARGAALNLYRDGFSDGKGNARIGGFTETTVSGLKSWLENGDQSKPTKPLDYPFKGARKGKDASPAKPAKYLKKPLTNYIKKLTGGIDPHGRFGTELRQLGITNTTAPGLFRRGGMKDLDNIPAAEHPELNGMFNSDSGDGYLDQQKLLDALAEESHGRPAPIGEQLLAEHERRAEIDAERYADDATEQDAQGDAPISQSWNEGRDASISAPESDFSTPLERIDYVQRVVRNVIAETGLTDVLTAREQADIVAMLDDNGGWVEDAIHSVILGSEANEDRSELASSGQNRTPQDPPFFGDERDQQPVSEPGKQGAREQDQAGGGSVLGESNGHVRSAAEQDAVARSGHGPSILPYPEADTTGLPEGYSIGRGNRELTNGRFAAIDPNGSIVWGWHDTPQVALSSAVQRLSDVANSEADQKSRRRRLDEMDRRLTKGEEPTDADLALLGLKEHSDWAFISPAIQELFAISNRKVREAMGDALYQVTSDSGTKYWKARTRQALKNAAKWISKNEDGGETAPEKTPAPAQEAGADGLPQSIMPGMERGDAAAQRAADDRQRQRLEMDARQKQSKMRRLGGNDGAAGPLFDDQVDMFGASAQPAAAPSKELTSPKKPDQKPAQTKGTEKIEDFGVKLEGARKDAWASYGDSVKAAAELDISSEPLSKSWPAPDYDKMIAEGADPWTVAFIRAAREAIPTKPQKSWRLKGWVAQVETMRGFAADVLDGTISKERLQERLSSVKSVLDTIDLYLAVGHTVSLKGLRLSQSRYSLIDGVRHDPPLVRWEIVRASKATSFSNMPSVIAHASTREEAINAFAKKVGSLPADEAKAKRHAKFIIYSRDGRKTWIVGVKIRSANIDLRTFDDVKEARAAINTQSDELQAQLDKMKEIPRERRDENEPRVGIDHRSGADVSPEQFSETFGFRGVQFGNWVERDRRQKDLNEAYDALLDLAGLIDISPRALSLNGSLGLAFGARGSGGKFPAAAHFEPGRVVINLTKKQGAGSLAHEWFHALDNYFSRAITDRKNPTGYITDRALGRPVIEGVRQEVVDAFVALRAAINKTGLKRRSGNLDKMKSAPYWGTTIEMHARSFESYVLAKLQDQSASNDYLANIVRGELWEAHAKLEGIEDAYPYLKDDEIDVVRPAFDALFDAMQERKNGEAQELYQLDMGGADPNFNGVPTSALKPVSDVVNKIIEAHGLSGKVTPRIVRGLLTASGASAHGSYGAGRVTVAASSPNAAHTARHEIIHALRDTAAWGAPYGLFSKEEWQALAKAARADDAIREAVEQTYPDLSAQQKTEEMVAELYADWATDRAAAGGALARALQRIKALFRAMAAALRGEGYIDAATVMQRIADGEIGGRGPDGGGSGRGGGSEAYQSRNDRGGRSITASINAGNTLAVKSLNNLAEVKTHEDARNLVEDGEITNESGDAVVITKKSARKWFSQNANAMKLSLAPHFAGLFEASQTYHEDATFSHSVARLRLDGVEYAVRFIIRHTQNEGSRLHQIEGVEMAPISTAPDALQTAREPSRKITVADAVAVFNKMAPDQFPRFQRDMSALKARLMTSGAAARGMVGNLHWQRTPKQVSALLSSLLTDAMGKNARFNVLSLVPGRALFSELGKNLGGAQEYLGFKEKMDSDRNEWQARSATQVDKWSAAARRNPAANQALMELMHDSTLDGLDPSRPEGWKRPVDAEADRVPKSAPAERREWAEKIKAEREIRIKKHSELASRYRKLPAVFKSLYNSVRDEYSAMADEMDKALLDNIRALSATVVKKADREHRKELNRIRDEGLTGKARADALAKANDKLSNAHARAAVGQGSRLKQMRQMFEENRLEGPYFPLSRFGNYFVTVREASGKVVSFSRFETEREQKEWAGSKEAAALGTVEIGVLGGDVDLREKVDPRFLADVEELLQESGASKDLMDSVWQRWLETLPDQSVRTNKIHRKGRAGYNNDAIRAFASAMFHGAHQMARLRYGAQMEDALETAEEQSKNAPDPNRAGFVVREMKQRNAFTMNPTNNPWVTKATGLAFVWYLGMSPAAAMVNVTQTTVVGVPLMSSRYSKAGLDGSIKALSRAAADFAQGAGKVTKRIGGMPVMTDTWSAENAKSLTAEERKAMEIGHARGVIDKTQSHDLASVADSGVEYNPTRERVMRMIGFMFHHAERFNREVTYLASYRLARAEGLSHDEAINSAASMTWKVHFDYSNTSKPRAMTGDAAKVLTVFRNFQVNMLFRLFRDAHQVFNGGTKEERAEARAQLVGMTLSMMAHAGIRGVWGYALITSLLSLFMPGADDGDDIDAWLQDALLMEGDDPGTAAWNWIMGLALNGAPGHALGINLTNRIGMPDLWFQSSGRDLEGQDLWAYYLEQLAGPAVGIGGSIVSGANMVAQGQVVRGLEKMVPTFAKNVLRTGRYAYEGVNTFYGDPLIENVNPWQLLVQLQGFTPAEVAERYKINNRLKNKEGRIEDRRKDIVREIGDAVRAGRDIPEDALERMRLFNREIPEWAITSDAIRASVRSRMRASQRNEFGVALNPKINERLRADQPPALYN